MGDTSRGPELSSGPKFFSGMERLSEESAPKLRWDRRTKSLAAAWGAHALVYLVLMLPPIARWMSREPMEAGGVLVRFYELGGSGRGSGGGGGGSGGERISAFIRTRPPPEAPEPEVEPEPRRAPAAPRKPSRLRFDDLNVPDLPDETDVIFASVFSPDAQDFPGLSLDDMRDFGGVDTQESAGTDGGVGGGEGTGVGSGEGWGVGPGRGGGFGGGDYSPGAWDIEPVLVFKPPRPDYPAAAREKMVRGEVLLEILVKLDGTTEVVRVLKSLPYCVEAARENAKLFRWKPALKEGQPTEAYGVITVTFELFAQG